MLSELKENTPSASYWKDDRYFVLDQLLLPQEVKYIECRKPLDIVKAIVDMNLRGAPLIGAAASAAAALFFLETSKENGSSFYELTEMLFNTRPTAVNLKNVLSESILIFEKNIGNSSNEKMFEIFRNFSIEVHRRDKERNYIMGEKGAHFISDMMKNRKINVLTHCNAGALATCGYGTALGVVRSLHSKGLINNVWIDETRPYLQGSRITAFEMEKESIPHKIITDSSAAWIMHKKLVDVIVVGADRVALNGDIANKIGSYSLAVNAKYHGIPFISVMPVETFDMETADGSHIVIEERSDKELLMFNGKTTSPQGSTGYHIGFDVVPSSLINAIVTEKGVAESNITAEKIRGIFYG